MIMKRLGNVNPSHGVICLVRILIVRSWLEIGVAYAKVLPSLKLARLDRLWASVSMKDHLPAFITTRLPAAKPACKEEF